MKINGTLIPANRKMFIYGGHDFNIEILLLLLDNMDRVSMPPFGSYLIFELHKINGTYGFKVLIRIFFSFSLIKNELC